jgi:solute:Na+ symporter, SSS family
MNIQLLFAFIAYFGALFVIGIACYTKTRSSAEFMLGARSVNYWVTAIAANASDMSAWLFMGFPAAIYNQGLIGGWIAIGLIGGMFASWHWISHKLRITTEKYHALTLSSFLEKRFGDNNGIIGLCSSIITILFFTFYIAAGLTGMGYVFESVFGINYHSGMTIGLIISLCYIIIGGFIAIAWNHFFQGLFLLMMIIIVPVYALFHLGSIEPIMLAASLRNISLQFIPDLSTGTLLTILNGITWGIGYLGMPHIIVNFMGIDNPDHIKRAKYLGMAWLVISLVCATAVGFIGIGYFPTLANSELVFVKLVTLLFNPLLTGFILCAILAATMSTIDTQIMVASSALTEDIYKKFFNNHISEKTLVWVTRLCILGVALAGYCLAIPKSSTVMGLVSYAWSGLASAFSPVVVAALYSKRINKWGALSGILAGGMVSAFWPLINSEILPLIPGALTSFATLYIVSALTQD